MTEKIERTESSVTMSMPEAYYGDSENKIVGSDGGAGDPPYDENHDSDQKPRKKSLKTSEIIQSNPKVWYKHTKSLLSSIKSNWLLVFFIPAVVLTKYQGHISAIVTFIFDMLAIIPLAKILTVSIDDMTARLGPAYSAVLHAFSGNCVELIILGFALKDREYAIVRSSVLGAILSNILLILGAVFLIASFPRKGQTNLQTDIDASFFVNTSASVLALAVLALVTPATFKIAAPPETGIDCDMQNISRATAIILLMLYAGLLIFQLKTHAKELVDMSEVEQHEARYFLVFDLLLAALSIAGITYCSRYLVTSIEHLAEQYQLGHSFVGMVLLPTCVMSNALEHWHAIKDAHKNKIDTAISLVLNTSV
ncbi:68_t:CDS:2, partial [Ambispora leptoticha]